METIDNLKKTIEIMIEENNLVKNEMADKMLMNHLKEMIKRNEANEKVPQIEEELFAQVNVKSLAFAEKIVGKFDNLGRDETFLLAIHFENMLGE